MRLRVASMKFRLFNNRQHIRWISNIGIRSCFTLFSFVSAHNAATSSRRFFFRIYCRNSATLVSLSGTKIPFDLCKWMKRLNGASDRARSNVKLHRDRICDRFYCRFYRRKVANWSSCNGRISRSNVAHFRADRSNKCDKRQLLQRFSNLNKIEANRLAVSPLTSLYFYPRSFISWIFLSHTRFPLVLFPNSISNLVFRSPYPSLVSLIFSSSFIYSYLSFSPFFYYIFYTFTIVLSYFLKHRIESYFDLPIYTKYYILRNFL